MNAIIRFFSSSIGKKWVVALTGLVLIGYVVGHLLGNLQIFIGANQPGPKQINAYAHFLHSMGPILYVIRAFLLACIGLHICTTIWLARQNRAARPQKYAVNNSRQVSLYVASLSQEYRNHAQASCTFGDQKFDGGIDVRGHQFEKCQFHRGIG